MTKGVTRDWIEVCPKCLGSLRSQEESAPVTLAGQDYWCCRDEAACQQRQRAQQAQHQREIDSRIARGRGKYVGLIVAQDTLGARFGYGNFYLYVEAGQDPQTVFDDYVAANFRHDLDMLVYRVLPIEGGGE